MYQVSGHIGKDHYRTEIKSATNTIVADEPAESGGKDFGFSPFEILTSSLAACTCVTVRMFADRKEWKLTEIFVEVTLDRSDDKSKFTRTIEFKGELDESQRTRLMAVANSCPVHKVLSHPIEIETLFSK